MESQTIINLLIIGIIVSKTFIFVLTYLLLKKNKLLKSEKLKLKIANTDLNEKAERIQFYFEELKNAENFKTKVLSIASHDLRAPFASLELLLQIEGLPSINSKEIEMLFEILRKEVVRSRTLLDEILLWTESQLRDNVDNKEFFYLNHEVDHLLMQFTCDISRSGKYVCNKINKQLRVNISKSIFSFVIRNVLSNAVKFGRRNGGIFLRELESGKCGVVVINEGERLCDEVITDLNSSNSWHQKKRISENGAGLGISLCKDLIKRIGGSIHFENKEEIGVAVSIIFPDNSYTDSYS